MKNSVQKKVCNCLVAINCEIQSSEHQLEIFENNTMEKQWQTWKWESANTNEFVGLTWNCERYAIKN